MNLDYNSEKRYLNLNFLIKIANNFSANNNLFLISVFLKKFK